MFPNSPIGTDSKRQIPSRHDSLGHRYFQTLDQIKGAESKATDLRKNYGDLRGKLNQQKELYQQVRSDRNGYSRALIESQDEISEMKRKFKIMFHQIEQLN